MADVAEIVLGYAKLWYAPVAEANPDPDSIAFGDDWGGNWAYVGDTLEPLAVEMDQTIFELFTEQSTSAVKSSIEQDAWSLVTVLAEHDSDILAILWNATKTTTAAGASAVGRDDIPFGGRTDIPLYKWGAEMLSQDSSNNRFPLRYFWHIGQMTQDGAINYGKGQAAGIPIRIRILADTSQDEGEDKGIYQRVAAAATG